MSRKRDYRASILSAVVIAGSVFVMICLSLAFDFGACPYPSRNYPYFTSGRLISGTLVPMLAFYVYGVAVAARRSKLATVVILGISLAMMVVPQIRFFSQLARSPYNWFHLP